MTVKLRPGLLSLVAALFLGACGSTATLRQGHEIAEAGTAYVGAMQAVADLAIEKSIDYSADGLASGREKAWGAAPLAEQAKAIDDERRLTSGLIHEISIFKAHTTRLGSYFEALGNLVSEPAKEGYVTATKELAASADKLGTTLAATNIVKSAHVTAAQQEALGGIAGAIGEWYQAKTVREVLKRDAATIEKQLVLQQKALETLGDIVASVKSLAAEEYYRTNVRKPFLDKYPAQPAPAPALPSDWKTSFATVVKADDVVAQVEAARKASKKFTQAWKDFTEGRWTTADLVGDMTRIHDVLEQAVKLHENRH